MAESEKAVILAAITWVETGDYGSLEMLEIRTQVQLKLSALKLSAAVYDLVMELRREGRI